MGKDYFKDSSIAPTHYLDHPEMAIWNSFFSAQELNCSPEKQSIDCFTNPIYNSLNSEINPFDSSLSSIVSSPASSESFLLNKLIGNSGTLNQIVNNNLPSSRNSESVNHVFPSLVADQGFVERASKFSCFSAKTKLGCSDGNNSVSGGNSYEKSSVSELVKCTGKGSMSPSELISRKRKTVSQGNSKEDMVETADEMDNAKRSKVTEEHWKGHNGGMKEKETKSGNDTSGDDESDQQEKGKQKPCAASKDYIHVRARRGQATDSHSLAERARREKISERMKLLEDLVPGCNKVTGKALMLDEIINYVQALQHQVEFLSMKLASVNTGMSSVAPKAMFQPNALYSSQTQQAPQQLKNHASGVSLSQYPVNPLDRSTGIGMPLPLPGRFGEGHSQISALCEDDLQSIVQMGISHDGQTTYHSLRFSGKAEGHERKPISSPTNENMGFTAMLPDAARNQVSTMKIEL